MEKLALTLASFCLMSSAFAERFDSKSSRKWNNPSHFNIIVNQENRANQMLFNLSSLPTSAKLKDDRLAWSENYWPSMFGGIGFRWNDPKNQHIIDLFTEIALMGKLPQNPKPEDFEKSKKEFREKERLLNPLFKPKLYTKDELLRMTQEELGYLSPAELYDISQGDYSYSLTKKVLNKYSPHEAWWEGICHGWSQAASNYPEPAQRIVEKNGIKIPFGSSDVKGLLAMHDAFNSKGLYAQVGARCKIVGKVPGEAFPEDGVVLPPSAEAAATANCADVNAGTFHIVLTNMIGVYSKGFVADVDRYNDVWNQPVFAYESTIKEEYPTSIEDRKNGIDKKVRVLTVMSYGDELEFRSPELEAEGVIGFVTKHPVTGTNEQVIATRNYEYLLELDGNGNIVGGEWISETRPDMLWMKVKDPAFSNSPFPLAGLKDIYKAVER